MPTQITKTTKSLLIILILIIIVGAIVLVVISRSGKNKTLANQPAAGTDLIVPTTAAADISSTSSTVKLTREEQYKKLSEDKIFVNVFNNFNYPGSQIKDAAPVEQDGSMFYIILETNDNFSKVENFYKSKNIQSIWSRSKIFESTSGNITESFLNSGENASDTTLAANNYFKYSFTSNTKDQLLNILARSYSPDSTQIIIIYWKLSN